MYTYEIFKKELMEISRPDIREFVLECLKQAPDYFYTMPASTTGKYHPEYSLGEGGLIRHTKAAVLIAIDLLSLNQNKELAKHRDEIISALILHDCVKKKDKNEIYTAFNHPLLACNLIREVATDLNYDDPCVDYICDLIKTHMGQWNSDKYATVTLPIPETDEQKFVHMCDYLASRKHIQVDLV